MGSNMLIWSLKVFAIYHDKHFLETKVIWNILIRKKKEITNVLMYATDLNI